MRIEYLRNVRTFVRMVYRAAPGLFYAQVAITAVAGVSPLGSMYLGARLLELVASVAQTSWSIEQISREAFLLLGCTAGLTVVMQGLALLGDCTQKMQQKLVAQHIQELIATKAAMIDLEHFETPDFHNRLAQSNTDAAYRPFAIVQQLLTIGSSLSSLVALSVVIAIWHWWLLPVIVATPLVVLWLAAKEAQVTFDENAEKTKLERDVGYIRGVLAGDQMAKDIRLFCLQPFFLSRFRSLWADVYALEKATARRRLFKEIAPTILLTINQASLAAYVLWQVLLHRIGFREFVFFTQSMASLQGSFTRLMRALGMIHEHALFVQDIAKFLAIENRVESSGREPLSVAFTQPTLSFRNVSFTYAGATQPAIVDLSFDLMPGETVALVGENGAGKSTLVKLIGGLYAPSQGVISLDGVDAAKIPREQLRQMLGMTMQDFVIYHLSVAENIGLGDVRHLEDRERIEEAARKSGLDQIVSRLPDGYRTLLGRYYRRGHEFSGGQRQLVALSRTLLRNAPILVLDEPTAALDARSEEHFFDLIFSHKSLKRPSVLLVTHRLSSVMRADRIIVLERGRMVEQGDHETLLRRGTKYAEMYRQYARAATA